MPGCKCDKKACACKDGGDCQCDSSCKEQNCASCKSSCDESKVR